MYVFGDSYSDIGEGYLDGNGPTAVAYLAQRLGFHLVPANAADIADQSLDFAISGAQTGSGTGKKSASCLLGYGMRNQVDDFAAKVNAHAITFDPQTTLFFIAGGLNDRNLHQRNDRGQPHRRDQNALRPRRTPLRSRAAPHDDPGLQRL